MFKLCLTFFNVMLMFALSQSNDALASSNGLGIGLQGGANINKYSTSSGTLSSKTGAIIGTHLEVKLVDYFYFQPELRVTQKGYSIDLSSSLAGATGYITANYIEFPLMFKIKLIEGSSFTPFVYAGPNVGFKVGDSFTISAGGSTVSIAGVDLGFTQVDFAMDGGGGFEAKASKEVGIFVAGRYSYGLIDVAKGGATLKSRGIQALAGGTYYF